MSTHEAKQTVEARWLSVEEVAIYLGVSRDTVYRWIEDRGFPAHKVGRSWKSKAAEIDNWVKSGRGAERPDSGSKSAKDKD
jgi:excisionase family DNA binding protein